MHARFPFRLVYTKKTKQGQSYPCTASQRRADVFESAPVNIAWRVSKRHCRHSAVRKPVLVARSPCLPVSVYVDKGSRYCSKNITRVLFDTVAYVQCSVLAFSKSLNLNPWIKPPKVELFPNDYFRLRVCQISLSQGLD